MIISTRKLVSGYFNGKGWSEGSKSKRFTLRPCTFTHLIQNTLIKKQNGRIRSLSEMHCILELGS